MATKERVSIASSTAEIVGVTGKEVPQAKEYVGMDTPNGDLEGGALTAGGAPDLFSKDCIGLLFNYAAVGAAYGGFPATIYPFMQIYLNMDGYQVQAATTLVNMPWSFKIFIGLISDSFPIMGYKRKPYMIFGWGLCFALLMLMSVLPIGKPYFLDPANLDMTKQQVNDILAQNESTVQSYFNVDAPGVGAKYIMLMFAASAGYVIADVAADAMVVEFAQREPESVRGNTQTMIYTTRSFVAMIYRAIVGFCMNGKKYGGEFEWTLDFSYICAFIAIPVFLVIPATIFLLKETKTQREHFGRKLAGMWTVMQKRVIWQVIFYKFLAGFFSRITTPAEFSVKQLYAKVEPLQDSLFNILGDIAFMITLLSVKKWGLQWDWRKVIIITTITAAVLDSFPVFLTVYNVVRSQYFWLGAPIIQVLPEGVNFIVSTFIVVEVADVGYEGATYGLLTTISNLTTPFASTVGNILFSYFNVKKSDIRADDGDVHSRITYSYLLTYGLQFFSLVFLVLLPRQKKEAQELKRNGGSSLTGGLVATIGGLLALFFSLTTSIMSIFPATSCYRIAGGTGCDDK